ncbi:MAG: hypothetical protein LBB91_06405 [Clostridiales bacterium]|jgi:hypothetical protein|nr:hypothetical protein [Clostridiales bacterium]
MRDNYDFSKGVKNPYADKLKKGYTVTVHYDFSQNSDSKEQPEKKDTSDNGTSCKQS